MHTRPLSILAIFLVQAASVCGQAAAPAVTIDWIFSYAPHAITAMPETAWLADGRLLISEGGRWDALDPAEGSRNQFVDHRASVLSLRRVTGLPLQGMPPIEQISAGGERALWDMDGTLVSLDTATGTAIRITDGGGPDRNGRLSPDGRRAAFTRGPDLYVFDFETEQTVRLTSDGSPTVKNGTLSWVYWEEIFGREDLAFWWSPDGRRIAFLRTDESMVDEVVHLDFRGPVPDVIKQRYPKAGTANPVVRLGIIDVAGESTKPVWVDLDGNSYEYLVRVHWLPGSGEVAVQTLDRAHQNLDLWFASASSGKGRKILSEHDEGWINIHDDLYFLKDGEHFLWVSERTGYSHLYRYRMDGTLVNAVTSGEWALKGASSIFWLRQAVAGIDEKEGWVYFGALERDPIGTDLYRIRLDGTGMARLSEDPGTHKMKMRPDGLFYVGESSSATRPPGLGLFNADGSAVMTLVEPRQRAVERLDLVYPEFFAIPARDGFPMPAYLFKPKDFDPERKYPLILYSYGGPSSRSVVNEWDFDRYWNQVLLREGFLVACVDNRSATGVSKKVENTISGMMTGDGELADLLDGVQWFKAQPFIDPDRVGIWGWSNGGMMTLLGMTRSREFKAGVSVAPVTDWTYYDTIWTETVMKRPQDNPEGYEQTNLWRRAKDLSGRLLLVHGTYDDNVHVQNAWHFVHELIGAGKMFDLMIYPMRQHGIADRAARIHLYNTMLEFWRRHL